MRRTRTDYAINRYYSPDTGRFTTHDPLTELDRPDRMNQPQGLNLYPYVMGGPTRYTDPDGLDWLRRVEEQVSESLDGFVYAFFLPGHHSDIPEDWAEAGYTDWILDETRLPVKHDVWIQGVGHVYAGDEIIFGGDGKIRVAKTDTVRPRVSVDQPTPEPSPERRAPSMQIRMEGGPYEPNAARAAGLLENFLFLHRMLHWWLRGEDPSYWKVLEEAKASHPFAASEGNALGILVPLPGPKGAGAIDDALRLGDDAARAAKTATAARGGATAVRVGQAGEEAVRATVNIGDKVKILVNGRTRIPDGLTDTVLSEVKNVKSLSYTRQLRDFASFAQRTGRRFDLYVRRGTQLSGPLEDAVRQGIIRLEFIL